MEKKLPLSISNLNPVLLRFSGRSDTVYQTRTTKVRILRVVCFKSYLLPGLQFYSKFHIPEIFHLSLILTNSFSMSYRSCIPSSRAAPATYPLVVLVESSPDSLISKTTRRVPGSWIPLLRLSPPLPQMTAPGCSKPPHPSRIPISKTGPPPRLVRLVRPPSRNMQSQRKGNLPLDCLNNSNPSLPGINPPIESSPPEDTVADHDVAAALSDVGVQADVTSAGVRKRGSGPVRVCRRAFRHIRCW